MIVRLSAEAEDDLEAIGDYIARDNPKRAAGFVRELRTKCLDLAELPLSFPLVPRYEQHGIRRRIHGDYLIFLPNRRREYRRGARPPWRNGLHLNTIPRLKRLQ